MVESLLPPSLDAVFRALADPTRRDMLQRLAGGDRTIGELAAPLRMSFAGASKHVQALERAGLLRRTVNGRSHVCSLNPAPMAEAMQWLRFYEHFWSGRLDALEAALAAHAPPTASPESQHE
ncbi:metalloregulator ArsR/SmtB family transcription factor [Achromobacter ruhlandii]|uniref:ArsR/SmtB family transcription factor n=1 Tax=Achromobacter ruhlandii TaxID=72557 RepID=UPI003016EBB0